MREHCHVYPVSHTFYAQPLGGYASVCVCVSDFVCVCVCVCVVFGREVAPLGGYAGAFVCKVCVWFWGGDSGGEGGDVGASVSVGVGLGVGVGAGAGAGAGADVGDGEWVGVGEGLHEKGSCVGLARIICISHINSVFFGGEITKYMVIYSVNIRFWPTLAVSFS